MENNNQSPSLKNNQQLIDNKILPSINSNKTTSLRPTRSIIPPKSLYRTGIKTSVNYVKNNESEEKEQE